MSESAAIKDQIREQLAQRSIYERLLTTEEAAAATGLSCYELRRGGKEGRYHPILTGSPDKKFRKQKWNLATLEADLRRQEEINQNSWPEE
jgi:hypothetical protein